MAAAIAVWGLASVPVPEILCLLAAALICSGASYAALALAGMGDRAVGYLEILALFALVYANPDIRVAGGRLTVALLNGAASAPASLALACLSLAAIPAAAAALALAARLARARRSRHALTKPRVSHDPLVRLYRADLPVAVFAASFVVEGALVVASSIGVAYLRGLSGALLALRLRLEDQGQPFAALADLDLGRPDRNRSLKRRKSGPQVPHAVFVDRQDQHVVVLDSLLLHVDHSGTLSLSSNVASRTSLTSIHFLRPQSQRPPGSSLAISTLPVNCGCFRSQEQTR